MALLAGLGCAVALVTYTLVGSVVSWKAALMYPDTCTISGATEERIALMITSASGLTERSAMRWTYLAPTLLSDSTMQKELEVPQDSHYNICMINMKETITYKELLDLDWAIRKTTIHAQTKYDERYQEYGKHDKNDLLTELAYDDLKLYRVARKTLAKAVRLMRTKDLYTYGD
jgi:hypothetical protein